MHIHPGSARSQPNQGFFMHPATLDGVPSSVLDDSPVRLVLGNCLGRYYPRPRSYHDRVGCATQDFCWHGPLAGGEISRSSRTSPLSESDSAQAYVHRDVSREEQRGCR